MADWFLRTQDKESKYFYHITNLLTNFKSCVVVTMDEEKEVIHRRVLQIFNPPKESDSNLDNIKKIVR